MNDDLDPIRRLRPDRIEPDDPGDPVVFSRAKERFMSTIGQDQSQSTVTTTPDIYPRLAYRDELAAVDYLTRVFQFRESREARMEFDGQYLCWMRVGSGVVMLGHANAEVHRIHSPLEAGLTTVMMNVYVHDIDAHYAHAVAEGATIDRPRGTPLALRRAIRRHHGPRWPAARAGGPAELTPREAGGGRASGQWSAESTTRR